MPCTGEVVGTVLTPMISPGAFSDEWKALCPRFPARFNLHPPMPNTQVYRPHRHQQPGPGTPSHNLITGVAEQRDYLPSGLVRKVGTTRDHGWDITG